MNSHTPEIPVETRRPGPPKELLSSPSFLLKRLGFAVKERMVDATEEVGLGMYDHAILTLRSKQQRNLQAWSRKAILKFRR